MAEELMSTFAAMHKKGPTMDVQNNVRGEMPVLVYLLTENTDATPSDISIRFNLSTARVSNTLNSLEKKGFVERVHDSVDRRKVFVHITDDGKAKAEEMREEGMGHLTKMLEALGEEDAQNLIRIVKKISDFTANHIETDH